jgi:hypothetical protein
MFSFLTELSASWVFCVTIASVRTTAAASGLAIWQRRIMFCEDGDRDPEVEHT